MSDAKDSFIDFVAVQKRLIPWADIDWESNEWDLENFSKVAIGPPSKTKVLFRSLGGQDNTPLDKYFNDYAKSILVSIQRKKPRGPAQHIKAAAAFRYLQEALKSSRGRAYPWLITVESFCLAERLINARDDLSNITKWHLVRALVQISDSTGFLERRFIDYTPKFKAPLFRRPVTQEEQIADLNKLIPEDALDALAEIFLEATELQDRIFINTVALCATLGFRIHEVLTLSVDCEVQEGENYGIRYWPEKGGDPYVKWVPLSAREVVKLAIHTLKTLCKPARACASRIEQNPNTWPKYVKQMPEKISPVQGARILSLKNSSTFNTWAKRKQLQPIVSDFSAGYSVKEIRQHALSSQRTMRRMGSIKSFDHFVKGRDTVSVYEAANALGYTNKYSGFGVISSWGLKPIKVPVGTLFSKDEVLKKITESRPDHTVIKLPSGDVQNLSGSLLVVFERQMQRVFQSNPHVVGPLSYSTFRFWLGEGTREGSIFDRFKKKRADGTRIVLSSHSFRHWITTLVENGGMSDAETSRWFGRKTIKHNRAYVHGTVPRARDAMKAAIRQGQMGGHISDQYHALEPVDREAFLNAAIGAVYEMPLGGCAHNFAATPCPRDYGCLGGCSQYLRKKGDSGERAKLMEVRDGYQRSIDRLIEAGQSDGSPWLLQLKRKVKAAEDALLVDSRSAPEGAVVRVFETGADLSEDFNG